MNLRFVEAFYWVASLKSISRAAERLFLTQSAMSSRIATLESELGILLLDRRDKQFKLTVAGARFLLYAEKLLELQREVKAEIGSGQPWRLSMRIGAIESVLHAWLLPWLEKLRTDYPGAGAGVDGGNHVLPPMEMVFVGNPDLQKKEITGLMNWPEWNC